MVPLLDHPGWQFPIAGSTTVLPRGKVVNIRRDMVWMFVSQQGVLMDTTNQDLSVNVQQALFSQRLDSCLVSFLLEKCHYTKNSPHLHATRIGPLLFFCWKTDILPPRMLYVHSTDSTCRKITPP